MNILVTNDDGINAPGLHILVKELAKLGNVYVSAPLYNKSGAGHSLTVSAPLRANKYDMPEAIAAWAVEGTPADCVKLGAEQLISASLDIIVSGINNGANLGTDVIYSGTVAGAMEGYFHGVPAIAVSVSNAKRHDNTNGNYQLAAEITREYADKLVNGGWPRTLLNINVPGSEPSDVKGVKLTSMGWRWYDIAYDHRVDPSGRDYYWIQGNPMDKAKDGNTDVEAVAEGYASVNPLDYDMTNYPLLEQLRAMDH